MVHRRMTEFIAVRAGIHEIGNNIAHRNEPSLPRFGFRNMLWLRPLKLKSLLPCDQNKPFAQLRHTIGRAVNHAMFELIASPTQALLNFQQVARFSSRGRYEPFYIFEKNRFRAKSNRQFNVFQRKLVSLVFFWAMILRINKTATPENGEALARRPSKDDIYFVCADVLFDISQS
ncbi:protein of unknown function [Burkholderia multivorans]